MTVDNFVQNPRSSSLKHGLSSQDIFLNEIKKMKLRGCHYHGLGSLDTGSQVSECF